MDGEAWWAAVHGISKSWTRLSDFTFTFHFHALEKEMATHSSVLAWRIPGTGEPGELLSMGSHRVGHDWSNSAAAAAAAAGDMGVDWQAVTANSLLVYRQGGKEERSRHLCVRVRSQTFYPPYRLHVRVFQTTLGNYFLTKHLTQLSCGLSTSAGIQKTATCWFSGWKLLVGSVCSFHLVYNALFSYWHSKIRTVHLRIIQISSFFYFFFFLAM